MKDENQSGKHAGIEEEGGLARHSNHRLKLYVDKQSGQSACIS